MSKLEKLLPPFILRWSKSTPWKRWSKSTPWKRWSKSTPWKRWENKSNQEIFEEIYEQNIWGKSVDDRTPFFSGGGSHETDVVNSDVESVKTFLHNLPNKPVIVDLGCGDFNIGKNFLDLSAKYIGCDVVLSLVEYNRERYTNKNLSFVHLDAVNDDLPKGDIVIIRQVLQHLSNSQIHEVLDKVKLNYTYLIFTEHLPKKEDFDANVDIPVGHLIRLNINSGLDIEKPPFNFEVKSKSIVDEIPHHSGGKIQTIVYEL